MPRLPACIAAASALALVAPAVMAQPGVSGGPVPSTPDFIAAASQTDLYERQAGELASRKGKSPQVRAFGEMMVRDHAQTTAELQAAIRKSGGTPPAPPRLRADQEQMLSQLQSATADFDKSYANQQVQAHEQALGLMRAYSNGGDNTDLRAVAAKAAPIVQHHLEMARALPGAPGG
jgi:putative membrane protein